MAKRVNRLIEDGSRSMITKASLPDGLWPFAVRQFVAVKKRVVYSTTFSCRYTISFSIHPPVKLYYVFGCAAYILKTANAIPCTSKPRAKEGNFLETMKHGAYIALVKRNYFEFSFLTF